MTSDSHMDEESQCIKLTSLDPLQIKARLYSIFVFALCLILLVFVKINSCATYLQTWLGLGPMAAMETATIISNMFFYMPKTPDLKEPMIQACSCFCCTRT